MIERSSGSSTTGQILITGAADSLAATWPRITWIKAGKS